MSQKIINQGILIKFGNQEYFLKDEDNLHIYQAPKSNCFIAACASGLLGVSEYCFQCINIFTSEFFGD